MRWWLCSALVLALASLCAAQTSPQVAPEARGPVPGETLNPLPRYMTPAERLLPLPTPVRSDLQPSGEVHCSAEYEPMEGILISWQGYTSILTQLCVGITVNDPNATVWVVVDSGSEQSSVYNTLHNAGAVMDQIAFIVRVTDTVWIRDYGPRYIFEDGVRTIIDHIYNRPRPNDDAFNDFLATYWNEPQYDIGLVHGGGNFHLFRNGDAFMSSLILAENPGLSEQDVQDRFREYQNVDLTIYTGFPSSYDSTRHIDMWMLPLGDYKILIGEYSPSSGQPYTITEGAVADLTARGYAVYRTPGWNTGGTHYTYTNGVILNNQAFISKFNVSQDAQALAVFEDALPGYQIHQIDCSGIIGAAGALHCIVMHVPRLSPNPYVSVVTPNGGEVWTAGQTQDIQWGAGDDVGVTSVDILLSIDAGVTFPHTIATGLANAGTYAWTVPVTASTQCRVKVVAYDGDGHSGEDVSNNDFTIRPTPPAVVHGFNLDTNPGWAVEGQWAYGQPTGGGSHARDPSSGHSGSNVYGYNLSGDYTSNLPETFLTTGALDCAGATNVELRFWRWLGVEAYDHARVDVSNDGAAWTTIWANSGNISESSWSQQVYDISSIADDQPTVYVRWCMGPTDGGVTYPGWNIDDVELWGVAAPIGDMNCDGRVDNFDISPFVLALTNTGAYAAQYPLCSIQNGDVNGDGNVDNFDITPFVSLLTGN